MVEMTREEAVRRWNRAKQQKQEMTERMIKYAIEEFERKHGEKPQHIEVW